MRIDLTIEPDSEVEKEFMEDLAAVRNKALDSGMTEEDVSRILSVYAQSLVSDSFDSKGNTMDDEDVSHCPDCGSLIEAVELPGIGMDVEVIPCGCEMDLDELPYDEVQDILK